MATREEATSTSVDSSDVAGPVIVKANVNRKIFTGKAKIAHGIPEDILSDPKIQDAMKMLPDNYNFEIHKTIARIRKINAKKVALQFPDGLTVFACYIADILERCADVSTVIMGDITYGACNINDAGARALGCDLLVHYAHSCLAPIDPLDTLSVMYVFVDIKIDLAHFLDTVRYNIAPGRRLALVSTIQFVSSLQGAGAELKSDYEVILPQSKPLSPGEILGCTSPALQGKADCIIYLGDGRFHLESIMISNPGVEAYKYDPYLKELTREYYETEHMHRLRRAAIAQAAKAQTIGILVGTLGRQGSMKICRELQKRLREKGKFAVTGGMGEICPQLLQQYTDVEAWVQIACPRLSIDWGTAFDKPVLTPYELNVALGYIPWKEVYPMDYYANDSLGPWTNKHASFRPPPRKPRPRQQPATPSAPTSSQPAPVPMQPMEALL